MPPFGKVCGRAGALVAQSVPPQRAATAEELAAGDRRRGGSWRRPTRRAAPPRLGWSEVVRHRGHDLRPTVPACAGHPNHISQSWQSHSVLMMPTSQVTGRGHRLEGAAVQSHQPVFLDLVDRHGRHSSTSCMFCHNMVVNDLTGTLIHKDVDHRSRDIVVVAVLGVCWRRVLAPAAGQQQQPNPSQDPLPHTRTSRPASVSRPRACARKSVGGGMPKHHPLASARQVPWPLTSPAG